MAAQSPPRDSGHKGHDHDCGRPPAGLPAAGPEMVESGLHHGAALHPALSALKRWLLWFLAFFGIYASSSVCPFCGTPGCPVGAGGAAVVGGFFAALWQYGRQWVGAPVRLMKNLVALVAKVKKRAQDAAGPDQNL